MPLASWFGSFPPRWHYDVLRALDYFRSVGEPPDSRIDEAIEILRSKQQPDDTWLLEHTHAGKVHFCARGWRRSAEPVEHAAGAGVLTWYDRG